MLPADFKAIRVRLGLSQRELGRIIRLSDRQVRRIEKDEMWPGRSDGIAADIVTAMKELEAQFAE